MLDACRLLARWALPEPSGILRFQEVLEDEEEMRRLFEEFVRGFYRLEQSDYRVTASPLSWRWEPLDEVSRGLLPGMRTDVLLSRGLERIVIDTKYTPRAVAEESGFYGGTLRSGHLYQMHAYLTSLAGEGARPLRGILLYPRVDKEVRATYRHADYKFEVRTIDLGAPWRTIHEELLLLVGTQGTAMKNTAPTPLGQCSRSSENDAHHGRNPKSEASPSCGRESNLLSFFQKADDGLACECLFIVRKETL
jgi:5-methylcytosine-specific restriction enzyme subunit McrC